MTSQLNHKMHTDQTAHDDCLKELMCENARLRGDLLTVAGRICHDLRAPLGGVIVNGEALKEMLADGNSPTTAMVNALLSSSDEIARLLKRTSFITKASASPVVTQPVHMADVLTWVLPQLERRIIESGAAISKPDSWPDVIGVSAWLETIWWNLLANALQHAGKAPKIELGWEEIEVGKWKIEDRKANTENTKPSSILHPPSSSPSHYRFWISDNGPGVSETSRSKLFQRFNSLHEMDSTRGLGLSIVQRLVELQGGDCGYETVATGGSTFFFTLPAATISINNNPKLKITSP